jgi:predicted nucleic acid-binding Zn ribbon protein
MRHDDDEYDAGEWDADEDVDDDGYVPCPHCGAEMYEDAGYCSSCERWISREEIPQRSLAPWMVVVIMILLAMFVLGALRLF